MDNEKKKELRQQYDNRHPDMGIICWESKGRIWFDLSTDAKADFNGTSFQLNLGSWPNRELQNAYKEDPESFKFSLVEELEYKDLSDDYMPDLEIMYLEFLEKHPDAMPMRRKRNIK